MESTIVLIPNDVKRLWDKWNIRSFILLSLLLQILLIFTASMRKKTANKLVITTIWSAYLLADWAASFAVGLVFDSEEKYAYGPGTTIDDTGLLLVLWAAFLLLLVGGQDRLTSFAIEDNELWLRHLIWLLLQIFSTGFVFIQSLHQNRLWIPTFLLILAGTIKYAERTVALYLASSDSFGISVLREADPGPNYAKLMRKYTSFKESNVPVTMEFVEDRENQAYKYIKVSNEERLERLELVQYAYHFANMYKGLIVNLIFSSREHTESREFFSQRNSEDALRILEIELNFFYDLLHTKMVVAHSNLGKITRFISFGLVVAAFSLFYKEEKRGFKRFDVKLTYTLFFGVLGLDIVALLLWISSDSWTVASPNKSGKKSSFTSILFKILHVESPRWSESVSHFSFIKYCLKESYSKSKCRNVIIRIITFIFGCLRIKGIITFIFGYLQIKDFIGQKIDAIFRTSYVIPKPLTKELWKFIFTELLEKSHSAVDPEEAKRISSARCDWILKHVDSIDPEEAKSISRLMPYIEDVAYEESILLWHIATELCYYSTLINDDEDYNFVGEDCELSKCLSEYMLYLLYQQPGMMSEVSGIAKRRFNDTSAEARKFFKESAVKNKRDACEKILGVDTLVKPVHVKGDQSKSVLFDACILAKELEKLGPDKYWKVISKVWVELLSYAASRSRANAHVQQLSKGGELLTFVWLLMAHFGLKEHWVENRKRAKLIVHR